MISFTTIVNNLKSSASDLTAVNTVGFGSLDKLDADHQNATYPFVFFRPLTSTGIPFNLNSPNMIGPRRLSFEMYVMDIPTATDSDLVDVMSNCEQIGYDIITRYYDGTLEPTEGIYLSSISPVFEAFQDRTAGWVFNIDVETSAAGITSCNRV